LEIFKGDESITSDVAAKQAIKDWIEKNAVTIIDWLMVEDKSQTDSVMKYFVEQLFKTNGFLIIFMQIKKNGEWFAPNMIDQFPTLAARYIYDNDEDGTTGKWLIDVIREAKTNTNKKINKYF